MAKIPFSKLKLKKNTEFSTVEWKLDEDTVFNIEVKDYLSVEDRLDLIAKVLNQSVDDNGFYNVARVHVFTILETIIAYTNISFTEKQLEDPANLYDLLVSSGLSGAIVEAMNPYQYKQNLDWIYKTISLIYEYKNSVYAILDSLKSDYDNLELDANEIYEKLKDKDNLSLLKDVVEKLG